MTRFRDDEWFIGSITNQDSVVSCAWNPQCRDIVLRRKLLPCQRDYQVFHAIAPPVPLLHSADVVPFQRLYIIAETVVVQELISRVFSRPHKTLSQRNINRGIFEYRQTGSAQTRPCFGALAPHSGWIEVKMVRLTDIRWLRWTWNHQTEFQWSGNC